MKKINDKIHEPTQMKVQRFLERIRKEMKLDKNKAEYPKALFDYDSRDILTILLSQAMNRRSPLSNSGLSLQISNDELSFKLNGTPSRFAIQRKLKVMARFWLLSVDSTGRKPTPTGIIINEVQTIHLNQALEVAIFGGTGKVRYINEFIKKLCEIGKTRDKNEQGLTANFLYGEKENPAKAISLLSFGNKFEQKTEEIIQQTAEKKANDKKWRDHNDTFVACAANLWRDARARLGFGPDIAPWSGETSKLGSAQREQRKNLTSIFEDKGGYVTALSWYVYVLGKPEKDAKGKLAFDPRIPHRQYKGTDMKPKKFANEISAIMSDHDFQYMASDGWPEAKQLLLKYFSEEILEVGPRDGTAYSAKLGYVLGQKPLPTLKK